MHSGNGWDLSKNSPGGYKTFGRHCGSRVDFAIKCPLGRFNISSLLEEFMIQTRWGSKTLYEPFLSRCGNHCGEKFTDGKYKCKPDLNSLNHIALPQNNYNTDLLNKGGPLHKVVYNLTAYGTREIPHFIGQFLNGGQYSINGKSFTNRTEHCMVKNLVEEWTVASRKPSGPLDALSHSQNSFQLSANVGKLGN